MSTDPIGEAISQIPFLGQPDSNVPLSTTNNGFVQSASAAFWLEWVRAAGESTHQHPSSTTATRAR
jgi:hypothetical protein